MPALKDGKNVILPAIVLAYLLFAAALSKASGTADTSGKERKHDIPAAVSPFPFGISPGSGL